MARNQKKTTTREPAASSEIDRATEYARAVLDGEIIAGPYVRGACRRHMNDLEHAGERGFYYDRHEAAKAIAFFEEVLCLNGGQFEGAPFLLAPWQGFVVGSIFGWRRISDGFRRFRLAYIETGKGSGKSPIAAGMGIYGLCADGESRAEIYAAATYKDQAMVLFRDAVAFYDQSPELKKRLIASGTGDNRWKLAYPATNSFFIVIASDNKKGKSGPRPHMYIADEVHEHSDGTVIGMLEKGFKFRRQPLGIEITNSGHDMTSFCRERHEMAVKVATEMSQNDSVFAYICSLDEEDIKDEAYLHDESVWVKPNPSLDSAGIPGYDYIRKEIKNAEGMQSQLASVKRLNFCIWTEAKNPWITRERWMPLRDDSFDPERLSGRRCWGGLDLSAVNDLTSFGLMFGPSADDPLWRLRVWFWVPGAELKRKSEIDHVPYDVWKRNGHIFTSAGEAISKTQVLRFIYEETAKYQLAGIAYDRNRIKDLIEFAEKEGIDLAIGKWDKEKRKWKYDRPSGIKMMPFGQEARSMTPAIDKFELMMLQGTFRHDGNPCLLWNASNVVVDADESGYRRFYKKKSTGRIDGIQVAAMCCGILDDTERIIPDEPGIMSF